MKALQELVATLADVVCCGDLWGHLQSWWRVVQGEIDVEARIIPTGAVVADDPPAPATVDVAPF